MPENIKLFRINPLTPQPYKLPRNHQTNIALLASFYFSFPDCLLVF